MEVFSSTYLSSTESFVCLLLLNVYFGGASGCPVKHLALDFCLSHDLTVDETDL